jgi:pimeloyl-ACP methyl ester carboxylesterase
MPFSLEFGHMNKTLSALLRIPLFILVSAPILLWGMGVPVFAEDSVPSGSPAITLIEIPYPRWFYNARGQQDQDGLKFGDTHYVTVEVKEDEASTTVMADLSALGIPDPVPMPYVQEDSRGSMYRIQSTVASHGDGDVPVRITVTDSMGRTSTAEKLVRLDNTPSDVSVDAPSFTVTTTTPSVGDTVRVSGVIGVLETKTFVIDTYYTLYDVNRAKIFSNGSFQPSIYGVSLSGLGQGAFNDYPITLYPDYTGGFHVPEAAYMSISLTVLDGATNTHTVTSPLTPIPHSQTASGMSNVLFLPGIEGSRLYEPATGCNTHTSDCVEEKIWEPQNDASAHALFLDENGKSVHELYAKEGDVVSRAAIPNTLARQDLYTSFFTYLDSLKESGSIADWKPIAYDWRLSLPDILSGGNERNGKIFYQEATTTPYIAQELRRLAATSKTGKVTIVAHSNGGLLAKALMQQLGDEETARLVDQVVLVGAPQSGPPADVATLLYGYGTSLIFDQCATAPLIGPLCQHLLTRSTARSFAEHSPMAYHLLPSQQYFDDVSDPSHRVVRFDNATQYPNEVAAYGFTIDSSDELKDFLQAAEGGRTKPKASETGKANVLSETNLLTYAQSMHTALDTWTPPASVRVHEIAGWGADTVAGIEYYVIPSFSDILHGLTTGYRPVFTEDGDGTVPVPSALQIPAAENVQPYWLRLDTATAGKHTHADIFESPALRALIDGILHKTDSIPDGVQRTRPSTHDANKKLIFILHGPGSLTVRNAEATYGTLGDDTYAIAPAGNEYDLLVQDFLSDSFTLDVQQLENDAVTGTNTFSNVPVTPESVITLSGTDLTDSTTLEVDANGDGTTDTTVPIDTESTAAPDPTPATLSDTGSATVGTSPADTATVPVPTATTPVSAPPVITKSAPAVKKVPVKKPAVKVPAKSTATTTKKTPAAPTLTAAAANAPLSLAVVRTMLASVYSILVALIGILAKMASIITSHS